MRVIAEVPPPKDRVARPPFRLRSRTPTELIQRGLSERPHGALASPKDRGVSPWTLSERPQFHRERPRVCPKKPRNHA